MGKASILAVDDDAAVLNAVERDLRQKYGRDYRILKAESGAQALDVTRQLKTRGEDIALFVVDQRMPHMSGVQFLEQALEVFPEARKILLTAYTDTEAAIQAINKVGIDYYLLKPWDPPQEHFYPVLDDLLAEWHTHNRLPIDGIRVVGSQWSPACHEIKDFLARNGIPYLWLDVERDSEARTLLAAASLPDSQVPVLFFPDGSSLVQPGMADLAQKVGLQVHAQNPFYDVVIIGGGPAGLSAAVYASFDGLKVLVVERQAPGGQAGNSPKIENYIGFPSGISGGELTRRAVAQARRFGAEFISTQSVEKVRVEGVTKIITLSDGSEICARMVLVATGKWFRTLTLPGVERWNGAGVYYGAAHTEAANYKNQDIFVIGAGNAAAQGVIFLAKYARKVSVLIRSAKTDWSRHLNLAIQALENVELCYNSELVEIVGGENKIKEIVVLDNTTQEKHTAPAAALFVFIGQKPQSEFLQGLVELTPGGNILTGLDLIKDGKPPAGWPLERDPFMLETSVPGIFAAGDVRNGVKHGVAAAVGDGGAAVSLFWQYLSTI